MTRATDRRRDTRDMPAYSFPEAAHYLGLSLSTLRSWIVGRDYPTAKGTKRFKALIVRPEPTQALLSFTNLLEAHVLAALRRKHRIKLPQVRAAIDFLAERYEIAHPLVDARFKTNGIDLFVEQLGNFVNVSQAGQIAIREVMEIYLERVEHDTAGVARRLYPFTRAGMPAHGLPRLVVIDPRVAFGRPVIAGTGIPTTVVADRYKAGESTQNLADDYGCQADMIEEAIRCELLPLAA